MKRRIVSVLLMVVMVLVMASVLGPNMYADGAVQYLAPVYIDQSDVTKGVLGWTTETQNSFTSVSASSKTWTDGWYVLDSDVTLAGDSFIVDGDVKLILKNGYKLTVTASTSKDNQKSGIHINEGKKLTIYAQSTDASVMGVIEATGGCWGSGIGYSNSGGISDKYAPTLCINGGKITAHGSRKIWEYTEESEDYYGGGAGIGGGRRSQLSQIIINGGVIVAEGACDAPGIGNGGMTGSGGSSTTCIVINGGTITAVGGGTSNTMVGGGAGIGSAGMAAGNNYGCNPCTIYINGGNITAEGGVGGAGIGSAIGCGYEKTTISSAKPVYISTSLIVKANNDTLSEITIDNTGGNLFNELKDKQYATISPKPAAQIVDTAVNYSTVQDAVDAAGSSETVKVLSDSAEDIVIGKNDNIILDLNGHVLSGTGNGSVVTNKGTLTITDSGITTTHNFKVGADGLWTLTNDAKTKDYNSLDARPQENDIIAVAGGCITGGVSDDKGGGIYNKGTLYINSGNIVGNNSSNCGGGIYNYSGSIEMSDGKIIGNISGKGGGIYNYSSAAFTFTGGEVSFNAANKGSGVYQFGTMTVGNTPIIKNNGTGSAISNLYITEGNAVSIDGDHPLASGATIGVSAADECNITNISGNDCDGYFVSDDSNYEARQYKNGSNYVVKLKTIPAVCEITAGADFLGNKYNSIAEALSDVGAAETEIKLLQDCNEKITIGVNQNITIDLDGHVLKGKNSGSVITNKGQLTIKDSNSATEHKFTVNADGLYQLDENGTEIVNGGCITGGKGSSSGYGGGILNKGTLAVNGGNILGNTAQYGGGIYVTSGSSLTMKGGYILGNTVVTSAALEDVKGGNGGGVYVYAGSFKLSGGEICSNAAAHWGGGVYIYTGAAFEMIYGTISGNKAADNGGGVYTSSSKCTISGGDISGNYAQYGAGVYDYRSELTFGGTTPSKVEVRITDNIGSGGALSNVYLTTNDDAREAEPSDKTQDAFISIGEINEYSEIGISMEVIVRSESYGENETGRFTTGSATANNANKFTSDNIKYEVEYIDESSPYLKLKYVGDYNFNEIISVVAIDADENITSSRAKAIAKAELKNPADDIVIYGTTDGGFEFIVYDTYTEKWYDYTEDFGQYSETFMRLMYSSWIFDTDYLTYTTICDIPRQNNNAHIYVIGELDDKDTVYAGKTFNIELNEEFLSRCTVTPDRGGYYMLPEGSYYLTDDLNLKYGLQFDNYAAASNYKKIVEVSENNLLLNGHVINGSSMTSPNAILFPVYCKLNVYGGDKTIAHNFKDSTAEEDLWVWDDSDGTYTVNGGVITGAYNVNNDYSTGAGGAVMNCHACVNLFDVNLIGNYADKGAAIFCTSGDTDFENQESIHMEGGSIQGNKSYNAIVYGYADSWSYNDNALGILNIENVTINNNTSEPSAIIAVQSQLNATGCTFTGNGAKYGCIAAWANGNNVYSYITVAGCTFTQNKTQWGALNVGGHFTIKDTEITRNTITNTEDERLDTFGGAGIDFWGDYTPDGDGYFVLEGKVICKDNFTNGEPDNLLIELYGSDTQPIVLRNFSKDSEIGINHADTTTNPYYALCVWSEEKIPEGVFTSDFDDCIFVAYSGDSSNTGYLEGVKKFTELDMNIDYSKLDFTTYKTLVETLCTDNMTYTTNNGDTVYYGYEGISIYWEDTDDTYDIIATNLNTYKEGDIKYQIINSKPKVDDVFGTIVEFWRDEDIEWINYIVDDNIIAKVNGIATDVGIYKDSECNNCWLSALTGSERVTIEYYDKSSPRFFYAYLHFDDVAELMEEAAKVNGCDITFDTNGGTAVDPIHIDCNALLGKSVTTTRDNSTFNGWYDETGNKIDLSTYKFQRSTTLTAKWIQNQSTGDTVVPTEFDNGSTTTKIQVTGDTGTKASGLEEIATAVKENNTTEDVKIILTAQATTETEISNAGIAVEAEAIKDELAANEKADFIAITLSEQVSSTSTTTTTAITDTALKVVEVIIPYNISGKTITGVFRYHGGAVTEFTKDDTRSGAANTYYYADGYLHIFTTKFSTYAVGYTEETSVVNYSDPTYSITGANTENGKITLSRKYATYGDTVTITVAADESYTLSAITVKDASGKSLKLTNAGGGKYSFVMLASDVTVSATFAKVEEKQEEPVAQCPQDATCVYAKFIDTDTKAWYHDGVHFCVENKYMGGTGVDTFAPTASLSRGMVVTMLWRMEGSPSVAASTSYTDVPADQWYSTAVAWAEVNHIAGGYGSGKFGPEDAITREQLANVFYRYAQFKGYSVTEQADIASKFTDAASTHSWAEVALKWSNAVALINGKENNRLDPTGNASRAEAATILKNFCEKVAK